MCVFANMAPIFHVLYWEGGHRYGIDLDTRNSPSICKNCGNVRRISASRFDHFHSALCSCGKEKGCTATPIQHSNFLHILKTLLSNLSGPGFGHPGQDLGVRARIWASWPGFGHPGQDLDIRARIWASGPGSGHSGQDLGIRARIWASEPGLAMVA